MFDNKNFLNKNDNFLKQSKLFLTDKRTVCVKHSDGTISKHHDITNPWRYIVKVKKQINVESAWIEEE